MEVEAGVQAVMWWREIRTTGKAWLPCPQLTPAVLTSLQRQTCIHWDPGVGVMCTRAQSLSPVPPFPAPWRVARIWGRVCARAHTPSLRPGPLFAPPWSVACQAPLSMGFSRQEYWSGLPLPSPGDLPDPGMEPTSPNRRLGPLSWRNICYGRVKTGWKIESVVPLRCSMWTFLFSRDYAIPYLKGASQRRTEEGGQRYRWVEKQPMLIYWYTPF